MRLGAVEFGAVPTAALRVIIAALFLLPLMALRGGWPEFRALDFEKIKHLLKKPVIVDTKNLLDSTRLRALGFEYVGVGRG